MLYHKYIFYSTLFSLQCLTFWKQYISNPIPKFNTIVTLINKPIYAILYAIFFLLIYTLSKHPLIDYLFSIEFFLLVERIHTSFYLLIDIIIYLIYSAFEFELKLSYQNLLFLTIGLTFFVIFFSFLVTYLIELNVRKVIKGYLKKMTLGYQIISEHSVTFL